MITKRFLDVTALVGVILIIGQIALFYAFNPAPGSFAWDSAVFDLVVLSAGTGVNFATARLRC